MHHNKILVLFNNIAPFKTGCDHHVTLFLGEGSVEGVFGRNREISEFQVSQILNHMASAEKGN